MWGKKQTRYLCEICEEEKSARVAKNLYNILLWYQVNTRARISHLFCDIVVIHDTEDARELVNVTRGRDKETTSVQGNFPRPSRRIVPRDRRLKSARIAKYNTIRCTSIYDTAPPPKRATIPTQPFAKIIFQNRKKKNRRRTRAPHCAHCFARAPSKYRNVVRTTG